MVGKIEDFACFFYIEANMMRFDSIGAHKTGSKEAIIKNSNNDNTPIFLSVYKG
jgi:hypothetical protein